MRRTQRKEQRYPDQWEPQPGTRDTAMDSVEQLFADLNAREFGGAGAAATCGGCREFVEDGEPGRGTCLHPASGVLSPWTDTPACPYYARGSRRV